MQIAQNIKRFRQERNISQNRLAKELNITPQAVSKWENGQASPDIELLPKLAKFLGVSIDDLFETTQYEKVRSIKDSIDDCKGMESKEFLEMEDFLSRLLQADTENVDVLVTLGNLYLYYAKLLKEKAVSFGKKALQRDKDSIAAIHIINNGLDGENYDYKKGHHYWLSHYLAEHLQKYHNENVIPYLLDNLIADEKYEEAMQLLAALKQSNAAGSYEFYSTILKCYRKDADELKNELPRLETIYANDPETLYKIAYLWARNRENERAVSCWKKVLQKMGGSRFTDPLEQIAACALLDGKTDLARKTYLEIIDILRTDWNIESSEEILTIKNYIGKLEKKEGEGP